jgi:hypothetical protein
MKAALFAFVLLLLAAGCTDAAVTPTQEYVLSAPTLAPSPVVASIARPEALPTPVAGINDPTYAALPSGGELPLLPVGTTDPASVSAAIRVSALDGALLDGELFTHVNDDTRYPAALLVATDRTVWGDLPQALRDGGFTVLSMTLRPDKAVDDLLAMIAAFNQMNLVDPSRILVLGAGEAAGGVLSGCAAGVPMDALGLIGPAAAPPGAALQCRKPLLLAAAPSDPANAVVQQIRAESRSPLTVLEASLDPATAAQVIGWAQGQFSG